MSNYKKLIKIVSPILLAGFLVALILYGPFKLGTPNDKVVKRASTSISANVLRGDQIKKKALHKKYLFFIGSSELSRFDEFHPSVLAQKYHRNYRPFLLGSAGTQSLTHYFSTQAMGKSLKNKKVVVFISPQWFVRRGVYPSMFDYYYSKQQAEYFIEHANSSNKGTQYAAKRLLSMPSGTADYNIESSLKTIASGKNLNDYQSLANGLSESNMRHQDQLFTSLFIKSNQKLVDRQLSKLPGSYNYNELTKLADKYGAQSTTNNHYGIDNQFYNHRLKRYVKGLKLSQKSFTYEYGPEYSDFELLLSQFKKQNVTPLFVITPVNNKWQKYTGLKQSMLNGFDRKINYQLRSQGFNNIEDLSSDGSVPYFMQDTIHLGWRGWLKVDSRVKPFSSAKYKKHDYKLNDYFYTDNWQKRNPKTISNLNIKKN